MSNITVIGIDLAKDVFQLCGLNQASQIQFNKSVRRAKFFHSVLQHQNATLVMEACSSAHHWARLFASHGFTVKLVPAQFVKGLCRGNKNDAKDALAIAESASRPNLHLVPVKTVEQQDYQTLLRIRSRHKERRTATINQARGTLAEYGVVLAKSVGSFNRDIPCVLEDGENGLTPISRAAVCALYEETRVQTQRIAELDQQLGAIAKAHPTIKALMCLRGIGPITAVAIFCSVGNAHQFRNGRQLAAWIGLVPKQHGTGGRVRLGGISKRGNQYLRLLLIHGARTVINWMKDKDDKLSQWTKALINRRGKHKAMVAVANKTARMIWVVLNKGVENVPSQHLSAA